MKQTTRLLLAAALAAATAAPAADLYVSLSTGANKNDGSKEAPFKNLWKAVEAAQPGDTIHVAEGNYPGKMKCGWIQLDKPVSLVCGYAPDFSEDRRHHEIYLSDPRRTAPEKMRTVVRHPIRKI